jgi:hypothetical protein
MRGASVAHAVTWKSSPQSVEAPRRRVGIVRVPTPRRREAAPASIRCGVAKEENAAEEIDDTSRRVARDEIGPQCVASEDERRVARERAHVDLAREWKRTSLEPLECSRNPPPVLTFTDEGRGFCSGDVKAAPANEPPGTDVVAMTVRQEDVRHIIG